MAAVLAALVCLLGLAVLPATAQTLDKVRARGFLICGATNALPGFAQVDADGKPIFPPIRATVTGVWDTKIVPQNVRKPPVPKGAWVFMKED